MCNRPHYHFNIRMQTGKTYLLSEIDYEPNSTFIFDGHDFAPHIFTQSTMFTESTIGHLYVKVSDHIGATKPFVLHWKNTALTDMTMELRDVCINNHFLPLCMLTPNADPIELFMD